MRSLGPRASRPLVIMSGRDARGPEDHDHRRQAMLSGPLIPTILTLAAPNVVNVSVQSLVLIADGWFVGRLGTAELAALAAWHV